MDFKDPSTIMKLVEMVSIDKVGNGGCDASARY